MTIILNIGLEVSQNYLPSGVQEMHLKYEYIRDYLEQVLGTPMYIGLSQSTTEQTVVAQYSNVESVLQKVFWLASSFKQDCIAYAIQDGDTIIGGALVGNYAHEWNYGIFDVDYFIEPMLKRHLV